MTVWRGRQLASSVVIMLAALYMTACATLDFPEAIKLGNDGTTMAQAMGGAFREDRKSVELYIQAMYLLPPLTDRPPLSAANLQDLERVSTAIGFRSRMMLELGNTYTAFSSLAAYDASAEVEGAVKDLSGAVSAFGSAVDPSFGGIPDAAGRIAAKGLGLIAKQAQSARIKEASTILRERLGVIVILLEKEQRVYRKVREALAVGLGESAKALWEQVDVGSPHPILREQLGVFGLEYEPAEFNKRWKSLPADRKAKLTTAILSVVERRIGLDAELRANGVDVTIKALKDAMEAHRRLEEGVPLDLATITQYVVVLKELTSDVRELKK